MAVGDEAVRAFRKYARLCPDAGRLPYFRLCERLKGCCRSEKEALRIIAVREVLQVLRATGKEDTADAVIAVYMYGRGRTPRKTDISLRVRYFATERHLDERTVWRRLSEAKNLYMSLVGQDI